MKESKLDLHSINHRDAIFNSRKRAIGKVEILANSSTYAINGTTLYSNTYILIGLFRETNTIITMHKQIGNIYPTEYFI